MNACHLFYFDLGLLLAADCRVAIERLSRDSRTGTDDARQTRWVQGPPASSPAFGGGGGNDQAAYRLSSDHYLISERYCICLWEQQILWEPHQISEREWIKWIEFHIG